MKRGSITVFFALVLSIIIVLICTSMESVKMMCARTQIANGADAGMYSLFAQYDRYLLENYDLFYVDASYKTGNLQMGQIYRTVEEYMNAVLMQGYLDLSIRSGGITSFCLATDSHGQPFYGQVTDYMEDTLGTQRVQLLLEKITEVAGDMEGQQMMKKQAEDTIAPYEDEMAQAGNPVDVIREIQKMDILELAIADASALSGRGIDTGQLVSHRDLEQGMGALLPAARQSRETDKILFQEYIMQKCGNYMHPSDGGGLAYPAEYIIGKSGSDRENLKRVAECLLRLREGVNFAYLYTDPEKREQSAALAEAISDDFLAPPDTGAIETELLLCWTFGESVLDVRTLFGGGRVSLQKNPQNWNLPLENLPNLLGELSVQRPQGDGQGLDYEDYLRVLLFMEPEDSQVMGGMDIIEADVRNHSGRGNFRLDCCLEAMEVEADVQVGQTRTYTVLHRYGYNL